MFERGSYFAMDRLRGIEYLFPDVLIGSFHVFHTSYSVSTKCLD